MQLTIIAKLRNPRSRGSSFNAREMISPDNTKPSSGRGCSLTRGLKSSSPYRTRRVHCSLRGRGRALRVMASEEAVNRMVAMSPTDWPRWRNRETGSRRHQGAPNGRLVSRRRYPRKIPFSMALPTSAIFSTLSLNPTKTSPRSNSPLVSESFQKLNPAVSGARSRTFA